MTDAPEPTSSESLSEDNQESAGPQLTYIKAADGRPTEATFGFNAYAERINGRFAMIGFVALLVQEALTHQDFFTWIGLR